MKTEKLELRHLAPYHLFDLKIETPIGIFCMDQISFKEKYPIWVTEKHPFNEGKIMCPDNGRLCGRGFYLSEIKPFLFPLSSLTKEIEVNGVKFIPVEIFEIGDDGGYNLEFDFGNIKLIKKLTDISKHNIYNDLQYLPFAVLQELISWHFDIYGLLPAGIAIDATTLETYK